MPRGYTVIDEDIKYIQSVNTSQMYTESMLDNTSALITC